MNNLNSILIEGRLVREPTFRSTAKGTPLCTFCLASNRYYKQDSVLEKEVSFFDVETWSKLAEMCRTLGRKGRGVRVVGRLKQNRWNGPDGAPHSRISIVAEHVEFRPDPKQEAAGATYQSGSYQSAPTYQSGSAPCEPAIAGMPEIDDFPDIAQFEEAQKHAVAF
jgi:single-strand DNA-binding protein